MSEEKRTNQEVLVWGLARTGVATARYLARQGGAVVVADRRSATQLQPILSPLQHFPSIRFELGVEVPSSLQRVRQVILSPGVPYDLPALNEARARGVETISEIELAARSLKTPTLAVTGSAGKSTTVSLAGSILSCSGYSCFVGGNLGYPLIELIEAGEPAERAVVELSSFQLEATSSLRPQVAVLTNLSPNHLDRHKTMEVYAACKARLFRDLPRSSWLVTRGGDESVEAVVGESQAQRIHFYPPQLNGTSLREKEGAFVGGKREAILLRGPFGEECYGLNSFRLRGDHNLENAMAAILAARLCGATPEGIAEALLHFGGLEHRLEFVGEQRGVRYINDSKATTPAAAARSIESFDPGRDSLRLLAGGRSKGTGFGELVAALQRVTALYLFGEAAPEIEAEAQGTVPLSSYQGLRHALKAAQDDARPGDVILLSPACTSFDEFTDFEHRGRCFKKWTQPDKEPPSKTTPQ